MHRGMGASETTRRQTPEFVTQEVQKAQARKQDLSLNPLALLYIDLEVELEPDPVKEESFRGCSLGGESRTGCQELLKWLKSPASVRWARDAPWP